MEEIKINKLLKNARLSNLDSDYKKLNIILNKPQPKEDGMRTDGGKGSYEWWYTDAEFEDGTTIVTIFYAKNYFDVHGLAWPTVDIDITYKDGNKIHKSFQESKGTVLNAKKDICNVKIGKSYIKYENGYYIVHYEEDNIKYHAIMTSKLPMWRPNSGHWFYGNNDEHFFAWFVAQPFASIEAFLKIDDKTIKLKGTGYHDHNWGNISMNKLMNHWYWGRARVEGYNIIACDIIAEKEYNYKRLPVFMIAKDGDILTDDQSITEITREDTILHPQTQKFIDNRLIYRQPVSDTEKYTVEFIRKRDIVSQSLLGTLTPIKRKVAKLLRVNPTYTRILGEVKLTHEKDGVVKVLAEEGLWEQMFFGGNKDAIINSK